ncbi:MAG: PqqD family protein [Bacteroidetes bacterium]|nr:PqqD family protein [Bacteroidota bacterium]MBU1718323.1 PqqD family protein [Bacteroidota bacterium]
MKIRKNIAISENGFLFNPVSGESFSVNPIGVEIITLLKEDKAIGEISEILQQKFNSDKETIEKDISDFLSLLTSYSLAEDDGTKNN